MKQKKRFPFITALSIFIILIAGSGFSKDYDFLILDPVKVTSYDVERVVFQRVEKFVDQTKDNSFECLLIIKNRKMYFLGDGYDNVPDVMRKQLMMSLSNIYEEEPSASWMNKINGKPDFIQIFDRRNITMMNNTEEFVSTNFGTFYKAIRAKFIKEHVDKYHQLLRKRGEADINIIRKPIRTPVTNETPANPTQRYSTIIKVKASDETVYTCEDIDGDGVTETFIVHLGDGFNWGYKSGANLIFIYGNTDKDLETLIGKLVNDAVYGSVEDEKEMIETFPKEKDITDFIKFITPLEPDYTK